MIIDVGVADVDADDVPTGVRAVGLLERCSFVVKDICRGDPAHMRSCCCEDTRQAISSAMSRVSSLITTVSPLAHLDKMPVK